MIYLFGMRPRCGVTGTVIGNMDALTGAVVEGHIRLV